MRLKYASAVVRCHALLSELLTPEQIRRLAETENFNTFIDQLSETPYGNISLEAYRDVSVALEQLFYRKFIERISRIIDITPKKIASFLQTYYYMRFEILNLKRILRGKFGGIPSQQILESLIPIEPYHVKDFKELLEQETIEEIVKHLHGTPYSNLSESIQLYKETEELWPFELSLNNIYASTILKLVETLSSPDRVLVKRIVELETDIENLLIALKQREMVQDTRRLQSLFPTTFKFNIEKMKEFIESKDIKQFIIELGEPYTEILSPIYEGDVSLVRSRLRQQIYRTMKRGRSMNDFGFNVIIAYLVFCEIEKDDLVGMSWSKAQGISSENILKYLVLPQFI